MHWDHRVGRRLKLRDLHVLLAVAQAGSMGKAAAKLAISQPAISRAIADMEHTLGITLLDRNPQGVELTQYGHALVRRGLAVFDELKQGVQDIEFLSNPDAGELSIGSSAALAEGIVLAVVEQLSQRYRRVVFHVEIGDANLLFETLRERRIELGFARISRLAPEDDINVQILFDEPMIVVAGTKNPWARRRKIKLAELLNEPWTWPPPGTLFNSLVVEAFHATGLEPPRAAVYTPAINMRIGLAATGRFLAVVPAGILRFRTRHTSITKLPVELPATQQQVGIVTLKNRTLSPLAQLFIESAHDVAKRLAKGE